MVAGYNGQKHKHCARARVILSRGVVNDMGDGQFKVSQWNVCVFADLCDYLLTIDLFQKMKPINAIADKWNENEHEIPFDTKNTT